MTKTAFLTGGSSGIGQAILKQLNADGWKVIALTRDELNLADLAEVTSFAMSPRFAAKEIDAFIHVAGIWHNEQSVLADKAFRSFTVEEITQTMNVGVNAAMLLVNRLLVGDRVKHVLAISGTFEGGAKGWLPYYTSKRALEDFLVGLAQDNPKLAVYGISPADTNTAAYRRFYPQYAKSAQSPEIVAKLIKSLLDERESKYPSGSIIEVRNGERKLGFHV